MTSYGSEVKSAPPEAILFDSGGVLMQPIGGRWNPRADFEETVLKQKPGISTEEFARAFEVGNRFMDAAATTPDHDPYHAVMLEHLGVAPTPELLAELVRPVPATSVLELFADVLETLTALRSRGVRMAVVSDAWPSLTRLHDELGIHEFFEAYAISAVLGCRKPDPRMYRHASDALGVEPASCLFVDDASDLVAAAIELGYQGRWMRRGSADEDRAGLSGPAVPSITSLKELIGLF